MALDQTNLESDHTADDPLLIDVKSACRKLDLSRPTIDKLLKEGRLKSVSLGRRKLINYSSVRAFAEGAA